MNSTSYEDISRNRQKLQDSNLPRRIVTALTKVITKHLDYFVIEEQFALQTLHPLIGKLSAEILIGEISLICVALGEFSN